MKNQRKTVAVGLDFGNSEMCVTVIIPAQSPEEQDIVLSMTQPTGFATVNVSKFNNLGINTDDAVIIRMEGEATQWGIGHVALAQSKNPWTGRGDIFRYANRHAVEAALSMTAKLLFDEEEFDMVLASGLPAEVYINNPSGIRGAVKTAFVGPKPTEEDAPREKTYRFSIDGGKSWKTCTIKNYAACVMEGAGVLIGYSTTEKGEYEAVIDVGGRTTDLYVARRGQPVFDLCKGINIGVVSVGERLAASFQERYGFTLTPLEIRQTLYAFAASHPIPVTSQSQEPKKRGGKKGKSAAPAHVYPSINNYGEAIPEGELVALTQEAVNIETELLVSFVRSTWNESDTSAAVAARYKPVLGAGGGMFYFYRELLKSIRHLQLAGDPVYGNAQGYAVTALKALKATMRPSRGGSGGKRATTTPTPAQQQG
jgi:hypothetical protein